MIINSTNHKDTYISNNKQISEKKHLMEKIASLETQLRDMTFEVKEMRCEMKGMKKILSRIDNQITSSDTETRTRAKEKKEDVLGALYKQHQNLQDKYEYFASNIDLARARNWQQQTFTGQNQYGKNFYSFNQKGFEAYYYSSLLPSLKDLQAMEPKESDIHNQEEYIRSAILILATRELKYITGSQFDINYREKMEENTMVADKLADLLEKSAVQMKERLKEIDSQITEERNKIANKEKNKKSDK
jgi:hypothetical protein